MARKPRSNSNRRNGPGRGGRPGTKRHYPRTARLNTLLQEIVAGFFERVEDERFDMLTITGVEVDNDLNRARVFVSDLGRINDSESTPVLDDEGMSADDRFLEALSEYRKPVQAKIASEARIRKTPEVVFAIDPGVLAGARIDEILSDLHDDAEEDPDTEADDGGNEDPDTEADSSVAPGPEDPES